MKKLICIIIMITILITSQLAFAHGGRTDANGGHKDNKNVSGLGSYHYHCGGHPSHLHSNGVCQYSGNMQQENSETKTPIIIQTNAPVVKPVTIKLFGEELKFVVYNDKAGNIINSKPKIINGKAMVPLRMLLCPFNLDVNYYNGINTVIYGNGNFINFKVGNPQVYANYKYYTLTQPPIIENGITYIPIRFIAELLGLEVKWDNVNKIVYLDRQQY